MNQNAAELAELEESRAKLRKSVADAAAGLNFGLPAADGRYSVSALRRGMRRRLDDPVGLLTLIQTEGGVLTWQEGSAAAPLSGRRGFRRGALPEVSGEVITRVPYAKVLGLNEVSKHLVDLDKYLNKEAFSRRQSRQPSPLEGGQHPSAGRCSARRQTVACLRPRHF
jgi:hypothetical protein